MDSSVTIAGKILACTDITGRRTASMAEHQYAGHNGADLEHMGWAARKYRLQVLFKGSQGASDWKEIQQEIIDGASVEFLHPAAGSMTGKISEISDTLNSVRKAITVEFSFTEDGIDNRTPSFRPTAADVVAQRVQALADLSSSVCAEQFYPSAIPAPDLADPNWLEKLGDLGNKLNSLVRYIAGDMARLDGLITAFSFPVSAAFNALEFGAELPGQLALRLGTVLDLMQGKVAGSPDPAAAARKFLRDSKSLADMFRGSPSEGSARVMSASQGAQTLAALMTTDEDRLQAMQAYESQQPFDANGRWAAKVAAPAALPTTSTQMADLVGLTRGLIQDALPWVGDMSNLERIALALQDQFRDRLVEFERIYEVEIAEPTPLHVICHRYGLPYNAAERLILINPQIKNPTFTQGRIKLYAA